MKALKLPDEERIEIPRNGQRMIGYLKKYKSDTVLVFCSGGAALSTVPNFFQFLLIYYKGLPINILRFDFLGSGESDGDNLIDVQARVEDLIMVLDYCNKRWKHIVLYAPSMGALIACLALQRDNHVDKLITVNGLFNFRDIGLNVRSQLYFYRLLHPVNYRRQMNYIEEHLDLTKITIPTIVCYGTHDTWVHPKQSLDFYNANPRGKQLLKNEGSDHHMTSAQDIAKTETFVRTLRDWILKKYA